MNKHNRLNIAGFSIGLNKIEKIGLSFTFLINMVFFYLYMLLVTAPLICYPSVGTQRCLQRLLL